MHFSYSKKQTFVDCSYEITVSCKTPDQVGSYTGDLFFHVLHEDETSEFLVLRYIRFYRANELMDMLKPTAPYQKRKKAPDVCENDIIPGVKPSL